MSTGIQIGISCNISVGFSRVISLVREKSWVNKTAIGSVYLLSIVKDSNYSLDMFSIAF